MGQWHRKKSSPREKYYKVPIKLYVSDCQAEKIRAGAKKAGVGIAEYVRQAIDKKSSQQHIFSTSFLLLLFKLIIRKTGIT